ncbi:hypothetical protein QBC37DRAFT_422004 [Rhypophila decipiens]|uniref:Protein required for cell viability n=1 Tax=Rhypophila decipiens TaxID=261697 RepID=A0AAN6Y884_9PEZI|nr:hypothetical protein QBC37DRAFT_422004 [Rhypophila decipiens]
MTMDQSAPDKNGRQRLMQSILDHGAKAFSPEAAGNVQGQAKARQEFDELLQGIKTPSLIAALNVLIRPGHSPPWLRTKLMEALALVPLRPDGVRITLEFVFSVHPSSTVRATEAAVPQKKGANITLEALTMASNLISSPHASVPSEAWYACISPQLLELLDGVQGPELVKAASYIIGFGILGRKASGAPGTPGWKYLAEPILHAIKPPLGRRDGTKSDEEIIDLSKDKVLVNCAQLASALRRLQSLTTSHPNPGLCKRLLYPLLLPLWALSSWPNTRQELNDQICTPALELLKIYLKLAGSSGTLFLLVHHLGYVGGLNFKTPEWVYKETENGELRIVETAHRIGSHVGDSPQISLLDMDNKIPKLLELVTAIFSDADIATVFLELLERWLNSSKRTKITTVLIKEEETEDQDPMTQLTELKVLQAMMSRFPEKLATQPKHILSLVSQILAGQDDTANNEQEEEEVAAVALSLLNMIVTVPGFEKSKVDPDIITSIETSLEKLSSKKASDLSQTAQNLKLLLKYRDELDELTAASPNSTTTTAPTARQIEDRKTYSLAISYITAADSPPPVKSEGLNLLSNLITAQSPVLDIPGVLVLLSSLMRDSEDYINLRVIKMFTLLASSRHHPKAVTRELLDHYIDAKETETVDSRLRFGEALLQVVDRLGETFTGDLAKEVGDALLNVAGRRGQRPKTEARQKRERDKQMRQKKKNQDLDPDMDMDEEEEDELTSDEKAREEILARIVSGWESRRGTEDVRIRASALSIFSSAVETNIAGLGPTMLYTAVDLCVSILRMETDMEKGILRRAAVLLVLSFVRALDKARSERRSSTLGIGFGMAAQQDILVALGYVAQTDNDGLVRQHARDVIESLENWNVASLVGDNASNGGLLGGIGTGLPRLAGLVVDPGRSMSAAHVARDGSAAGGDRPGSHPRIEEIE